MAKQHDNGLNEEDVKNYLQSDFNTIYEYVIDKNTPDFYDAKIVTRYKQVAEKIGIRLDDRYMVAERNPKFRIYRMLIREHLIGRTIEEDERLRKESISKEISIYDLKDFQRLFCTCKFLEKTICDREQWSISTGLDCVFEIMEKRGIQTNIGNLNREIRAANRLMKSIRQLIQNLKGWITELGEKRKELLAQKAAEEATLLPNLLMKYMEIRKEERKDWTRAGQNRGTSQDLKAVSEALSYLRQKGLSTVEDLEAFLESSGKSAADYRNQMKPKEARSKVIDGILASRTDCKECKPVYEKYQKIFFKKTKEKFKQEHPEVARYAKAAAYLAKHPDDKDSTQKELQEEQETLLSEIAELKVPLTEVQEDLKKLRDIRYWVRKATPGTEESKEPPKKQPIKEVLQDKADEKKAQRTAPVQTKHKQQDMEL